MRKKRLCKEAASALLMLIFISLLFWLSGCSNALTGLAVKEVSETGKETEVYFCPQDNCGNIVTEMILSADESVHCALYGLSIPEVKNALIAQNEKGVDVRLVVDNDNYKKVKELNFAKQDDKNQLMHNKFCIIDSKTVFTGSFNPTVTGDKGDNNNLIVFYSEYLADNYEKEFGELWSEQFGKGSKVKYPAIVLNGGRIENYFCPEDNCKEHVLNELSKANSSIYFMLYSFTDDELGSLLAAKHNKGVNVKGIMEKQQISEWSEYEKLSNAGINVAIDNNKGLMHHKVWIIDNVTVITGSFNPTKNGNERNDENIAIMHDERIAEKFLEEFNGVMP